MGRPVCVALISDDVALSVQLRWAAHIAILRDMDIVFVRMLEAAQPRIADIDLTTGAAPADDPAIAELRQGILDYPGFAPAEDMGPTKDSDGDPNPESTPSDTTDTEQPRAPTRVALKIVYSQGLPTTRVLLTKVVRSHDAALYTSVRGLISSDLSREFVVERARFLAFLPCEKIVCQGVTEDTEFDSVTVLERAGANQRSALRLAADLAADTGRITALQINPDIGIDAQQVGERRLTKFLAKHEGMEGLSITRRVEVNDSVQAAVQDVWQDDAHGILVVPSTTLKPGKELGFRLGRNIPVAVTVAASPLTSWTRRVVQENLRAIVPQIAREERVELVERVQSNTEWNFDFVTLMVLSVSIAALGLMQNSAAVVIGAMLVAPLMTPILGLGLALVQGNLMLTQMAAQALGRGVLVGLLAGVVFGSLNSEFTEPTREVFARVRPGLMDIVVAFLSGIAAAYAQSRPNLLAALPGVAIAAALVPPLVASGLLLSLWEWKLAFGAFALFIINMVAIVLASMIALFAVGIRSTKQQRWPARIGGVLLAAFAGLFIWSSTNSYGVDIAERVPTGLAAAVEEVLGPGYALIDVAIAYDELGYQLNLDVAGTEPIPPDVAKAVRLKASEFYGEASRIRLVARITVDSF